MARIATVTANVYQHQLTVVDCATCGEVFATTTAYNSLRRRDANGFSCPNGHSNCYSIGESADAREKRELRERAERAEREAASQKSAREWAESRAKGANIQAGKARAAQRRLEHRIACGVCPKCQRTFKQLAAHMKHKHPEVVG